MKSFDLEAATQKAYRLLSLRPHSERELEKKLREKGFPAVVVKETLEKLHDLKYLNDASFARQWARNLVVNKLWGDKKAAASLREKGIVDDLINAALEKAREEISEEEAIEILIKKKAARRKTAALDFKEKQKIFRALMGRGFPPGLILNKLGKIEKEEMDDNDRQ
ncbi:MAG TPA: RecX family transcriptional regulator [Smithella sp.]|nr:RecX family transcriptional regulator [Smithella sp.]